MNVKINMKEVEISQLIETGGLRNLYIVWYLAAEASFLSPNEYLALINSASKVISKSTVGPRLNSFLNLDELKSELETLLDTYSERVLKDESLYTDLVSELTNTAQQLEKTIFSQKSSVEKAEAWLYSIALNPVSDGDLEAFIYFKSQGESLISKEELSDLWRQAICKSIAQEHSLNRWKKKLISKAKEGKLSMEEINNICSQANYLPDLLVGFDDEEDFLIPMFFRIIEWFELEDFALWEDRYAYEASTFYQTDIDQLHLAAPLFYFSRSDLLLEKSTKAGIDALLERVCVGDIHPYKPWLFQLEGTESVYIPLASIIGFSWNRISPAYLNQDVFTNALSLLKSSRLSTGAWPLTPEDHNGDIFSTCLALTALCIAKPVGYKEYVRESVDWLLNQQANKGYWHIHGIPEVMSTILCLEAIKLARGDTRITYNCNKRKNLKTKDLMAINLETDHFLILCEGDPAGKENKNFDEECYNRIFSQKFPNAVFCSVGSSTAVESEKVLFSKAFKPLNLPYKVIGLIDRDDKQAEDIERSKNKGIRVLSRRTLESYLLADDILEKLCVLCNKKDKFIDIKAAKEEAVAKSVEKGKSPDDLKRAASYLIPDLIRILNLKNASPDKVIFLKNTMVPLITPETDTYKLLRKDIFGK